jgi:hypothetical protein
LEEIEVLQEAVNKNIGICDIESELDNDVDKDCIDG